MLDAIAASQEVLQVCTHVLLEGVNADEKGAEGLFYEVDEIIHSQDSLPQHYTITIGLELDTKRVVVFNSLTFNRVEVVTFYVSTPFLQVSGS